MTDFAEKLYKNIADLLPTIDSEKFDMILSEDKFSCCVDISGEKGVAKINVYGNGLVDVEVILDDGTNTYEHIDPISIEYLLEKLQLTRLTLKSGK